MLALGFEFEQRRQPAEIRHLMLPEEKTLSLSFELTLAENRGTLNLVFPAVVSNALLRKMAAEWVHAKRRNLPDSGQRLRAPLLECPFRMELALRVPRVRAFDLVRLAPGDLLTLQQPAGQPATLRVGHCEMFTGSVARRGAFRAAQVLERCAVASERKSSL